MKKITSIITAVCAAVCCAFAVGCSDRTETEEISIFSRPSAARGSLTEDGKKVEWLDVESFCCYYGAYDEKMDNYDVAICESKNLGADGIAKLNAAGVYTICYITIGEDDSLNTGDGLGEGGYASYYIYENGAPKKNDNWNSYFVDAGSPVWQEIVIEKARKILAMGADGLFMDTVDSVDVDMNTLGGMISLIKRLREEFPEAKLVANRGFSALEYVSQYLDGLMFESFNTTWDFEKNYAVDLSESANEYNVATAVNTINKQRQYHYFPVFALDYINPHDDYLIQHYMDRSWTYDFIAYFTTAKKLDEVYVFTEKPQSARGSIALKGEGDIAQTAGQPNGDTSAENLAYVKNGVTLEVDSYYSNDYRANKTAALNDAFISETMYWAKRAWASAEEKPEFGEPYTVDHWIEATFSERKDVSLVNVYWGFDNGAYYAAQTAVVQAFVDGEWKEVARVDGIQPGAAKTELSFDTVNTQKIRILQPAGKGASYRPGIMWVGEIEIYA